MDIKEKIMFKIMKICKQQSVNSKIIARASPYKEIREGYIRMLSSFFTGIPLFMFKENNNSKKYSQERKMATLKIIEMRFEDIFRNYLKYIKEKYPKNIWKIESN